MKELERIITSSPKNVFPISYNGRNFYVKKNINSGKKAFHRVQSLIFLLTRNPLFAPTVLDKRENRILHEVDKLMTLKKLDLSVPAVVRWSDQYFIMEDCGVRLDLMIGEDPKQDREYLLIAIKELAKLHKNRECHGGCQLRNFTWGNGRVFMIDFEEKIKKEHFYGIALRDLVLFLLSAVRAGVDSMAWTELIECYEAESGMKVKSRLLKVLRSASCLRILVKRPLVRMLSRDVIDTITALETLRIQSEQERLMDRVESANLRNRDIQEAAGKLI